MKKLLYTAAFVLPLAMMAGNADAFWHRSPQHSASEQTAEQMNHNEHMQENKEHKDGHKAENAKHHDKDKMAKKMQKCDPSRCMNKKTAEINEDYDEAIYKINKSGLSQEAKDLLISQAKSNKELAMKLAKEKVDQRAKNMEARQKYKDQFMQEKRNRKAVKAVEEIL